MSSISSDASFSAASLERLGSHVALDDLQQQGLELAAADGGYGEALRGPQADPGETVLNAAAWEGVPDGERMLQGDATFEARLSALDLSQAADQGADAILEALA